MKQVKKPKKEKLTKLEMAVLLVLYVVQKSGKAKGMTKQEIGRALNASGLAEMTVKEFERIRKKAVEGGKKENIEIAESWGKRIFSN